jgi:hypothetical protein
MTTIPNQPPINHEAAANALIAAVRELVQSGVPGFTLSAKGRRRKISTTATLSEAFLEAVAAACAVHPELATNGSVTAAEIRDTLIFSRVNASLAEELRILARGVDDTVAERRNNVGQRALLVYNAADRINRIEDRELLIPHLAAMKRTLNRGRINSKRAATARATAAEAAATKPVPADEKKEVTAGFKAGKDLEP